MFLSMDLRSYIVSLMGVNACSYSTWKPYLQFRLVFHCHPPDSRLGAFQGVAPDIQLKTKVTYKGEAAIRYASTIREKSGNSKPRAGATLEGKLDRKRALRTRRSS